MVVSNRHPVALIFFNRLEPALLVAQKIIEARPPCVYLIADGPRANRPGEAELCQQIRRAIENLPWPCPVHRIYSDKNLGCGKRVSTGITTALSAEEALIILEDDILPHPDFFRFCDEMLDYYRNDDSVFMISGLQFKEKVGDNNGYQFDFNIGIWGWATWKRAWRHYKLDVSQEIANDALWSTFGPIRHGGMQENAQARHSSYVHLVQNKLDTWDFQWGICHMKHRAYCISPNWNLVKNIGFGADSTHTTGPASSHWAGNYQSYPFRFPICHPEPGILITATDALENGDYPYAVQLATEGITKFPREPRLQLCLALANFFMKKHAEAIRACHQALAIDPEHPTVKALLGKLHEAPRPDGN